MPVTPAWRRCLAVLCAAASLLVCAAVSGCDDAGESPAGDTASDTAGDVPLDAQPDTGGPDVTPDGQDGLDADAELDGDASDADVEPGPAPSVLSTRPADAATGVARASAIQVELDAVLDPTSLDATTFALSPSITGNHAFDAVTRTATFQPNRLMDPQTRYTVTLSGLRAADGAVMSEPYTFSFTTGDSIDPPVGDTVYESGGERAEVSVDDAASATRTYTLTTTAALRDDEPASGEVVFAEAPGQMTLRSGNLMFDALFAMALEEARQNSVSQISDWAFNNGQGVACECFETGAKWNYVWTRDTAYAVELGLALVDPQRAKNSLAFKLSERKSGGDLQIVQDTGSGGSYPVSSDRVVWALGAWEVLKFLDGAERTAFRDTALEAMKNTIEQDRAVVYDARDGLYRGEQSFLDWREQSYPSWTAQDTVHLGLSKSLSTNVGHHAILTIAAQLAAETGDAATQARYQGFADELAAAIARELWLDDAATFSAMKTTELDPAATHKLDLLGLSLAVLRGVASPERAESIVAGYPHSVMGPPVLWPQQPLVRIYHNRGIWPFVTAYGLLAARAVGNDAVFDHDLESLVRGAALNLSNMENFEFLTQRAWVDDGEYSGPVVNSRRQLWSVAGYLGAVTRGVFGLEATQQGLRVRPFVTRRLRSTWFANTDTVELRDVPYRGRRITLRLSLPALDTLTSAGPLAIATVDLDGVALSDPESLIMPDQLAEGSVVTVTLVDGSAAAATMTIVEDNGDFRRFWAPKEPTLGGLVEEGGLVRVDFDASGESGVELHVYRDGTRVAGPLEGGATSWTDPDSADLDTRAHCYTVESVFVSSGNRSHHSPPRCWFGSDAQGRVQTASAHAFRAPGHVWSSQHGRPHYEAWGAPDDELEIATLVPRWSGRHLLQLEYGNGSAGIDTGITAAVKQVRVERADDGTLVADDIVFMPQLGTWSRWARSSFLELELEGGTAYRVRISDGVNMSYFAHFVPYTAAPGGGNEPWNQVNVAAVVLLAMDGTDSGHVPSVTFDGSDDLADLPAASAVTPGAPLETWSRFALHWDDDFVYVVAVTPAFEAPYAPFMLYLDAGQGTPPAPVEGSGTEYSALTPSLPFTPRFLVTARQRSDDGASSGPYNGLWEPDGAGSWRQLRRLEPGVDAFLAGDLHTQALRLSRAELGEPTWLRVAGHVVHAQPANEWKELVPAGHTPWAAGGGAHLLLDLGGPSAASAWVEVP